MNPFEAILGILANEMRQEHEARNKTIEMEEIAPDVWAKKEDKRHEVISE